MYTDKTVQHIDKHEHRLYTTGGALFLLLYHLHKPLLCQFISYKLCHSLCTHLCKVRHICWAHMILICYIVPNLVVVIDHQRVEINELSCRRIRNLVNIFSSKEDFLWDALQVSTARECYCQKCDQDFVAKLNRQKLRTMEDIKQSWYTVVWAIRTKAIQRWMVYPIGRGSIKCIWWEW